MVRLFLCVLCSLFLFVQNASCEILHAQKYRNWTSFLLTEQPGYAAMSTTAADGSTLVLLLSGQDGIVRILSPSISQKRRRPLTITNRHASGEPCALMQSNAMK